MKVKVCPICSKEFVPSSSRQKYCKRKIVKQCKECGKEFISECSQYSSNYCSKHCASTVKPHKDKICPICNEKFHPTSCRQKYCKKEITKVCPVCGKNFKSYCGSTVITCGSKECKQKYAYMNSVQSYSESKRICKWCGKEFTPINNTQIYCNDTHYQTCVICGKQFVIDLHKQDKPKTCSKSCANQLRFKDGNPFHKTECREKAKETMIQLYGVDHPMHSEMIKAKVSDTYLKKTGYSHPSYNPEVRSKSAKNRKISKFELRVKDLLDQYEIKYIQHYMISKSNYSHEFDFYLFEYKILVDCDGVYFHSYLEDPDGGKVQDYYDEDRLYLIPEDHIFHVIVEGQEEHDTKELTKIIKSIDSNAFNYEGYLFKWCRSIDFPYPNYTTERMKKDWNSLCKYHDNKYNPASRLGDSIIQNYHRSIYDAHVKGYVSPKEGWYDDNKLKRVILNRLIYVNDVDPYKILRGFNISKICPRVSIFNPVLAKYIVETYLSEFDTVFDPFSGYSGRLLGCVSAQKHYIGQDLNASAVKESQQIIDFLEIADMSSISVKDALDSTGEYPCLVTCPPYYNKETYAHESEIYSCDTWISEIMKRYNCQRYAFVVDKTVQYTDYIKEEIKSTSHFNKTLEYLIVID